MSHFWRILGWIFTVIFGILALMSLAAGEYDTALGISFMTLAVCPSVIIWLKSIGLVRSAGQIALFIFAHLQAAAAISSPPGGGRHVLIFLYVVIIASLVYSTKKRQRQVSLDARLDDIQRQIDGIINSTIQEHIEALSQKRRQLLQSDAYGIEDRSRWEAEIRYFHEKVILEASNITRGKGRDVTSEKPYPTITIERLTERIDAAIAAHSAVNNSSACDYTFNDNMTPIEYEHFCAGLLDAKGWSADVTKSSGDQGADVVATKNGMRAVVQCKLYSNPVGNKAVQEVLGAKSFYGATTAAVITNAEYTRSAIDLAHASNVLLLHHDIFSKVEDPLFETKKRQG